VTPLVLALQLDRARYAWTGPTTIGLLTVAAVLLVLFSVRGARSEHPLLAPSLFSNRIFRTATLALTLYGGAFMGLVVYLPLFLVNVVGVTATGAGAAMIPLSLGVVAGSTISGQLVSAWGRYKPFMIGGGLVLCGGILLLTTMDAGTTPGEATLYMVLCGLGIGPAMPLFTLAIQNDVDARQLGQATSASQFFRQIGGTAGAAAMGSVLAAGLAIIPAVGREAAFAEALRPVFLLALALALGAWLSSFMVPEIPLRRHFEATPGRGSSVGADDEGVPEGVELEEEVGR
jgi:predicted MFS family arabinose efflux permease